MDAETQLKEFKKNIQKNKETWKAAREAYLVALAAQQVTEDIEKESKTAVLAAHDFRIKEDGRQREGGQRITNPNQDYLMDDKDFTRYYKLVHEERTKRGLIIEAWTGADGVRVEAWDTTCDYKTRKILAEAQKLFLQVIKETLPAAMAQELKPVLDSYHWKHTPKILELSASMGV